MTKEEDKNSKKKLLVPILMFALSFCAIIGVSLAFFSDIIEGEAKVTAGTLDITGNIKMYVNGSTTAVTEVENFNPGDVVVVKPEGTGITNVGNKSAWIRTTIEDITTGTTFSSGVITIAEGEHTAAEMEAGTGITLATLPYTQTPAKIINGTGTAAETETGGLSAYTDAFTIYFDKDAGNDEQGKVATFKFTIQAMQYRNNNPTAVWTDIVTSKFGN